jgi:hypothetical protein
VHVRRRSSQHALHNNSCQSNTAPQSVQQLLHNKGNIMWQPTSLPLVSSTDVLQVKGKSISPLTSERPCCRHASCRTRQSGQPVRVRCPLCKTDTMQQHVAVSVLACRTWWVHGCSKGKVCKQSIKRDMPGMSSLCMCGVPAATVRHCTAACSNEG